MNRTEFLDTLRSQLSGQMHEGKVAAHVRYYEDYIQSQVRSGRNEQDVLQELGDPRLIARTLLDTDVDNGQMDYAEYSTYSDPSQENQTTGSEKVHVWKLDTWNRDFAHHCIFTVSYSGGSNSVFCIFGSDFIYYFTDQESQLMQEIQFKI